MPNIKLPISVNSIDSLNPDELESAKEIFHRSGSVGSLIGIIDKDHIQKDTRIVTVAAGGFFVTRFVADFFVNSPKETEKLVANLSSLKNIGYEVDYGYNKNFEKAKEEGLNFWIKRPLSAHTLSEKGAISFTDRVKIAESILEQVNILHRLGIVHGHLSLNNIGIDEESISILDAGLSFFCDGERRNYVSEKAPELTIYSKSTIASDIYGLGVIFRQLFARDEVSDSKYSIIERAVSNNIITRPPLEEFGELFISKKNQPSSSSSFDLAFILVPILFFLAYLYRDSLANYLTPQTEDFSSLWVSNQPSYMREVALKAINNNDDNARFTIIKSVLNNKKTDYVDSLFMKTVFSKELKNSLTQIDNKRALEFSLRELILPDNERFEWLDSDSPILVGTDVLLNGIKKRSEDYDYRKFINFPDKLGSNAKEILSLIGKDSENKNVFNFYFKLINHKKLKLKDKDFLALLNATVFLDYSSLNQASIKPIKDLGLVKLRVKRLLKIFPKDEKVFSTLFRLLENKFELVQNRVKWLNRSALNGWQDVSYRDRIRVLVDDASVIYNLPVINKIDLVYYSSPTINNKVVRNLSTTLDKSPGSSKVENFLQKSRTFFSREQFVTLLIYLNQAIGSENSEDKSFETEKFLAEWFATNPSVDGIIEFLIAFSHMGGTKDARLDSIFFASGNYLLKQDLRKITLKLNYAKTLAAHPEPLVRTFVYQNLSPFRKDERKILEQAVQVEPKQNIKQILLDRLKLK